MWEGGGDLYGRLALICTSFVCTEQSSGEACGAAEEGDGAVRCERYVSRQPLMCCPPAIVSDVRALRMWVTGNEVKGLGFDQVLHQIKVTPRPAALTFVVVNHGRYVSPPFRMWKQCEPPISM